MNSTVTAPAKIIDELSQSNENNDVKQDGIQNTKARLKESLKKWDEEDTFLWLLKGDLKAETESEIVAAQDQALQTKYYTTKYYKQKKTANADYVTNLRRL
jgi:hypothetical protein